MSTLDPPWLAPARSKLGVKEIPGVIDDKDIRIFHASTVGGEAADEVAWCSSFACWCMEQSGNRSPRSKRALSWLTWGDPIVAPVVGCVVVFDHGGGKGHVGFVVGKTADKRLVVLGGNQGNRVKLSVYGYDKVAGFRVPPMPVIDVAAVNGESTR